ncbi:MAG: bifunctional folylpolyglutamate synthase/dihydrofolate synthase [Bacteroidales bacterium]|jgi:dihydrofolate synthase/folylpolyglutamate synthase|nr:bifunctional folylpolyglutamate synthase/dihydrofolate synthase [Bacteroidales bacterium]
MNYDEVLEYLFNSLPMYQRIGEAAYKIGLENIIALDKYFHSPHKNFKTIHVAGTNGKGSVSHSLAAVLQTAGYKVGLYTSPHLLDFRERILVNGTKISKNFICSFVNNNISIFKELSPSFFEMSVALAFEYFNFMKVEIAVIEVGMGGRFDSTNIITPKLSIITNIGLDHTQFLGNTLEKIAGEKAGIIKLNIPIVIGESHEKTKKIFCDKATELCSKIYFAEHFYSAKLDKNNSFVINDLSNHFSFNLNFQLQGCYQEKNLPTILKSIDILNKNGFKISQEDINRGLENVIFLTHLHGRWQILSERPLIICDTGHNEHGLKYVLLQIKSQKFNKLHIVLGFVNDKNVSEILKIFPKDAIYYFTQANIPRAMNSEKLKNEAAKNNLGGNNFSDVKSAYQSALKNANFEDMIFIGGSTFVVADLLKVVE